MIPAMAENHDYFSIRQLEIIEKKIQQLLKDQEQKIRDPRYIFLDNADFMRLLAISRKTSENWRNQGKIRYSQINHKIYYRLADIITMMDNHVAHIKNTNHKKQQK